MNKHRRTLLLLVSMVFALPVIQMTLVASAHAESNPCARVTEIPQAECNALVSLYNSTNGADWWDNSGWLANNTPCDWHGIVCSGGHVRGIILSGNQLSGRLPAELGQMQYLQGLYLEYNELGGRVPRELGDLNRLVELTLHSNRLGGGIPEELGNLEDLRILSLADNRLTGEIPESLGRIENLETLYLNDNFLSGDIPSELADLVNLEAINLEGNRLSGVLPGSLADLVKKEIDLRSQPEMRAIVAQIEDLLPEPGNCGSSSIDSVVFDTEALEIRGSATISACHYWGKYPCGFLLQDTCRAEATHKLHSTFTYNLETNRISGNVDFGTIQLCPPADLWSCWELADVKVDIERLQRALEGDVVAALELIPTPKIIENQTRNEYDRIRQSKWDKYGRENVYFASRQFVNWASATKSAQWAAELIATAGAAGALIMAEVQGESIKELLALTRWLEAKGIREAARVAKDLLSGKSLDYPYIALHWQSVKYE